ncbi:alkaline phosphatase [Pasteurella langaaensis DSM 22999]|uniref:Alkaline phosphatase n=1 Tax=Alitibacter langaaensis DSM 22999 TaxID=1122935 RepID=A0A2U0SQ46_9PAST|nr:alkaline phosphatase [Pasteurella langaaensis]PVX33446.1 alkaline phosphatase [Pasteurella langaaensis DSM 22999]
MKKNCLALLIGAILPLCSMAQNVVYPIDRATMMEGSKFDFKVEFDEVIKPEQAKILINGKDFKELLGNNVEFVEKEDGKDVSALWVRDTSIAQAGDYKVDVTVNGKQTEVNWSVYATPDVRKAKNVILFIGDGLSVAHRTGARLLSKGINEGKATGRLAMDTLPYMGLIGTSSTDSIATDSANTASAYMAGHKSAVNALGVYASRSEDNFNHPKQETIGELLKRRTKMSVGIVSDAELQDATPAAVVAHTRRRAEKAAITEMLYNVGPDVMLGGGSAYFLPKSTPGSKRKDDKNFLEAFQNAGYQLVTNATELNAVDSTKTQKLLGLFHTGNLNSVLDRRFLQNDTTKKFPDQPDLTEMTKVALDVLSKNKEGFFLMVESALIDKASHPLDWERAFASTIMLDQSVEIAKEFAKTHPDTLVIVTGDHTHGISIIGTVDDDKQGDMREKVGTYQNAGWTNYTDENKDGYPDRWDVSKRLAVFFASFPDYYETFRPKLERQFVPAIKTEKGDYIANEEYKSVEGAMFREGNLPRSADTGVHAVDDMLIQAQGPGAEAIHGYMENSDLFKVIVDTLAVK